MEQNLPIGCKVEFDDPNALHEFMLIVVPDDGFWAGGKFKFHIKVRVTAARLAVQSIAFKLACDS